MDDYKRISACETSEQLRETFFELAEREGLKEEILRRGSRTFSELAGDCTILSSVRPAWRPAAMHLGNLATLAATVEYVIREEAAND